MRTKSTTVGIFFIAAAAIVALVLSKAFGSLFGALRVTDTAIVGDRVTLSVLIGVALALVIALATFAWPRSKTFVGGVLDELNKVNWPSWSETKVSTLVVIMTSVIAAMILGVFDMTFSMLSTWLSSRV